MRVLIFSFILSGQIVQAFELPLLKAFSSSYVVRNCPIRVRAPLAKLPGPVSPPTLVPFWKTKTELYKRITEDRYVMVSTKESSQDHKKVLEITTAGQVDAPLDFTYDQVTDYNSWPERIGPIQESKFDPMTSNLFVHGALLGFHIRMTMKLSSYEVSPDERVIYWESVAGGLVGMKGDILLTKTPQGKTEISLQGSYAGATLPIPQIIIKWGLEMAGQRAAVAMRDAVEEAYKKCDAPALKK